MNFHTPEGLVVPVVIAAQMRVVDELMIGTYHIELLQMMENAGRNLADFAESRLGAISSAPRVVVVLVGPGGNGGGGLVAARQLVNRGHEVFVVSAVPVVDFSPVTQKQAASLTAMGVDIQVQTQLPDADLILDCLLGYSLDGNPRGSFAALIEAANSASVQVQGYIASGLCSRKQKKQAVAATDIINSVLTDEMMKVVNEWGLDLTGELSQLEDGTPSVMFTLSIGEHVYAQISLDGFSSRVAVDGDMEGQPCSSFAALQDFIKEVALETVELVTA